MSMLKRVVVTLLIFGWAAAVNGAEGNPFFKNLKDPQELATYVEASLALDPTGHKMLDPTRCVGKAKNRDGSCARPVDYLKMFRYADPEARLKDVGELPAYLRSLVVEKAPSGKYLMAGLIPDKKSSSKWSPKLDFLEREFKPGETAWKNPRTGRLVLAQDCSNPISRPVDQSKRDGACAFVHFYTKENHAVVRFKQYGPEDVSEHECTGLMKEGESEFGKAFVDECYDPNCGFSGFSKMIGEEGWKAGSFKPKAGLHVLRLPMTVAYTDSKYRVAFCVEREGKSSCTIGVRWFDYLLTTAGTIVATIYDDEADARRAGAVTIFEKPTELWWHMSCPQVPKDTPEQALY